MARIVKICDGAEWDDILYWDVVSGTITASGAQKRSGNYSYAFAGTATGTVNLESALSEVYFRIGIRATVVALGYFLQFRLGNTTLLSLRVNPGTSKLEAWTMTGTTLLGTSALALQADTWYLIECHVKIADAAGVFDVRVDGATWITFAGDTKPGSDATIDNFYVMGANATLFVDDLGADDAAWCGDGRIYLLPPNANGDQSDWMGSDGNKVDNYALVDEIPPSDIDYVESAVIGEFDLYNLQALGLSGTTINGVWVEARARSTTASGDKLAVGIKSGVTEDWSPDVDLTDSWRRIVAEFFATNPDTGVAFLVADVDALQAGQKTR